MELKEAISRIYKEMKERLGIQNQPKVFIKQDEEDKKIIKSKSNLIKLSKQNNNGYKKLFDKL